MRSNKEQDKPSPGASSSVENPQELLERAEVVSDRSAGKNKFELSQGVLGPWDVFWRWWGHIYAGFRLGKWVLGRF